MNCAELAWRRPCSWAVGTSGARPLAADCEVRNADCALGKETVLDTVRNLEAAVLQAVKLGRSVSTKVLVSEATFEVRRSEILAIVGPSGSGKSSLLRLLNRLDEPTEGNVYLDEVDYRQIAP